ncbi:hypothetical protein E2C01_005855 [Portunus trituberculatus]|uniref:Heat shock protein beta-1 n=1 Tax=Portunus trituberculatus TaxID=210409 RepID=A0A5B7CVI4_PORTR|nr:hypothetical protein [Portunus trituberculatus]
MRNMSAVMEASMDSLNRFVEGAEVFSNSTHRRETRVTGKDGNTVVSSETESVSSSQQDQASSNQGSGSWLEGMNSPLIQQDGDCKQLKLRFDVSQYKPEEIVVKTVDNKLLVCSTTM